MLSWTLGSYSHSHYRQGSLIISYIVTFIGSDPINTKDLDNAINNGFTSGNFLQAEIDQNFTSHQGIPLHVTPHSHFFYDEIQHPVVFRCKILEKIVAQSSEMF